LLKELASVVSTENVQVFRPIESVLLYYTKLHIYIVSTRRTSYWNRQVDTTLLATVTLLYIGYRQRYHNDYQQIRLHTVRHPSKYTHTNVVSLSYIC